MVVNLENINDTIKQLEHVFGPLEILRKISKNNLSLLLKDKNQTKYILKLFDMENNSEFQNEYIANKYLSKINYKYIPNLIIKLNNALLYKYENFYQNFDVIIQKSIDQKLFECKLFLYENFIIDILINFQKLNRISKKIDAFTYIKQKNLCYKFKLNNALENSKITTNFYYQFVSFINLIAEAQYPFGVFTHGDFNFANILANLDLSNYLIIDWEYSDHSNRNRDYATFFMYIFFILKNKKLSLFMIELLSKFDDYIPNLFIYFILLNSLIWMNFSELSDMPIKFCSYLEDNKLISDMNFIKCINALL